MRKHIKNDNFYNRKNKKKMEQRNGPPVLFSHSNFKITDKEYFMFHVAWLLYRSSVTRSSMYLGAFLRTSNSCSVANGRPKTSFGLFFLSAPD